MTDAKSIVRAALREFSAKPLRRYLAERPAAGPIPSCDGDISWTADHLVDDPREPIITPLGVLDARGMMLVRVRIPIKVPMGFHSPVKSPEPDEVEAILPEDMLAISDVGMGVAHVDPGEAADPDEDGEDDGEDGVVNLSEVLKLLGAQGLKVNVDVEFQTVAADEAEAPGEDTPA